MTSDDSANIKFPFAIIWRFLGWYWFFTKIFWNYIRRPRINIDVGMGMVKMKMNNGKESWPFLLMIYLQPTKNIRVKASSIRINKESYVCLFQSFAAIFNLENDSFIINFFHKNWQYIDGKYFDIKAQDEPLKIPIPCVGERSKVFTCYNENSLLFLPKTKISLEMNINGKTFYYGLNRKKFYEEVMGYLAFKCKELKTLKEEYRNQVI